MKNLIFLFVFFSSVFASGSRASYATLGTALVLIPSEVGYDFSTNVPSYYWGWDLQIPLEDMFRGDKGKDGVNHKIPLSINKRNDGFDYSLGYRYSKGIFLGGVNYKYDDDNYLNPEAGLRFCKIGETFCLNFIYGLDVNVEQEFKHSLSAIFSVI